MLPSQGVSVQPPPLPVVYGKATTSEALLASRQSLDDMSFRAPPPTVTIHASDGGALHPPILSSRGGELKNIDFRVTPRQLMTSPRKMVATPVPSAPRRTPRHPVEMKSGVGKSPHAPSRRQSARPQQEHKSPLLVPASPAEATAANRETLSSPPTPEGYRSPGVIHSRTDIPARSPARLFIPRAPVIPVIQVQPIGSLHPGSPSPAQEREASTTSPTGQVSDGRPNYAAMTPENQAEYRRQFEGRFATLRLSYPTWRIIEPDPSMSLDEIHDRYSSYVKQIVVSMNCNYYKMWLIIILYVTEIILCNVMKLNAQGFAKSQIQRIQAYDELLVALGEKYYHQSESSWPIEIRIICTFGMQLLIFLVIKLVASYAGGDVTANFIQQAIDKLNAPTSAAPPPAAAPSPQESSAIPEIPPPAGGGDIGSMIGNLMGNADIAGMLSGLGNLLGGGRGGGSSSSQGGRGAPQRRVVFSE